MSVGLEPQPQISTSLPVIRTIVPIPPRVSVILSQWSCHYHNAHKQMTFFSFGDSLSFTSNVKDKDELKKNSI